MKFFRFSLAPVIILLFLGCTENELKETKQKPETLDESIEVVTYNINCIDKCGETECRAILLFPDGTLTCSPCSNCKMQIDLSPEGSEYNIRSDMSYIVRKFSNRIEVIHHINTRSNKPVYDIEKVEVTSTNNLEFLKIYYKLDENSYERYSMAFLTDLDKGETIIVDCNGDCGQGSSEICTEVYNIKTGEVYCKCQSPNCKMTIEE